MADKEDFEIDGRLLSQLRVVDLKQLLEKRGLSKSGSKKELVERLKVQLQLEQLQQSAAQDEGHVPNLALQDNAIGEQSDIIKEYLAQQQQIYEIQKEARRRVEQEEEEERQKQPDEGESCQEVTESGDHNRSMSPVKSSEDTADSNLNPPEKPPSKSESEEAEIITNVPPSDLSHLPSDTNSGSGLKSTESVTEGVQEEGEEMDLSVKTGHEKSEAATARKRSSSAVVEEDDSKPEKTSRKGGEQVSEVEEKEDVSTEWASTEGAQERDRSDATNEKTKDENYPEQSKSTRSLRPRLRRDVFHAEQESKPQLSEEHQGNDDIKSSNEKQAEEIVESPTEKQSDDEEDEQKANAEAVRSRLRGRPKVTREASTSSSSSSRSESPADKKHARDGSSNSSSAADDSPSESVSSSGSPTKTSRFKSHSDRQSKSEESSKTEEETKESGEAEAEPERPVPPQKRSRLNRSHSKTPEDESWPSKPTPPDTMDDVIVNQPDEEEQAETKATDVEHKKPSDKSETTESAMDIDNQEEVNEPAPGSETEKNETAKPTTRVQMRKLSLSSSKEGTQNKENVESSSDGEKLVRKRKWGSTTAKTVKKTSIAISTDSLKNLIPDVKPLSSLMASDNTLDLNEGPSSDLDDSRGDESNAANAGEVRIVRTVTQHIAVEEGKDAAATESKKADAGRKVFTKPLSLMEEPVGREGSPSPARNPPSRIIHIRNLVRPFTINQLKELLRRTGTLVEGGFWTDKIKSKCYATYETQEQATTTRQVLHGTQWPPSNRKNLIVDFADEEELQFHMSLNDAVEIPKPTRDSEQTPAATPREPVQRRPRETTASVTAKSPAPPPPPPSATAKSSRENTTAQATLPPPIREWDRVKIGERSPGERERRKRAASPITRGDRNKKERRIDGRDKRDKRDRRKEEEEAPAKLLDDLFKKTKSTPCIYWLPLTVEQIKQREDDRKVRQVEREKRRQQVKKDGGIVPTAAEKDSKGTSATRNTGGNIDTKAKKRSDESRSRKRSSSPPRSRPRRR